MPQSAPRLSGPRLSGARRQETIRRVRVNVPDLELPDNKVSNTKYTRWNFLIKTLWQQFSKPMNRYFLLIAILQLDSSLTPVNPASTWGPLILVTVVSMLKEHLDDRKRAESDRAANAREFHVFTPAGELRTVRSADIRVGELVRVLRNEEVPCDLVLLATSEEGQRRGTCYVQTTNIDGEADLKLRRALPQTHALGLGGLGGLRGVVECAPPNADIYVFDSTLNIESGPTAEHVQRLGLSSEQFLPQSTHVRKCEWVVGVAVYTGSQTKLGCNKQEPPFKYPTAERVVNRISVAIFCFQLALTLLFGVLGVRWRETAGERASYLMFDVGPEDSRLRWMVYGLRFLLLMSIMIPISLAVTLDILRWTYARWISDDVHMYDESTDTRAVSNSTAVPEDLGQIGFLLTDKTGTLTENEMVFRRASIGGVEYGNEATCGAQGVYADAALAARTQQGQLDVLNFWRCLALCNTSTPLRTERGDGSSAASAEQLTELEAEAEFAYSSVSPDEEALCDASQHFGVALVSRRPDGRAALAMRKARARASTSARGSSLLSCVSGGAGSLEHWAVLHELPFSSERKRMAIVARNEGTGQLVLFAKGADEVILPRLASVADGSRDERAARTARHTRRFARQGLRTLLVAMRPLGEAEYQAWAARLHEASVSTVDRGGELAEVFETIERRLELLGASAIEDRLQPEVPQTIAALRMAGVRVWMLTGDKRETAVEVSRACSLVSEGAYLADPFEREPSSPTGTASLVDGDLDSPPPPQQRAALSTARLYAAAAASSASLLSAQASSPPALSKGGSGGASSSAAAPPSFAPAHASSGSQPPAPPAVSRGASWGAAPPSAPRAGAPPPGGATRATSLESGTLAEPMPVLVVRGETPTQVLRAIRTHAGHLAAGRYGARAPGTAWARLGAAAAADGNGGHSRSDASDGAGPAYALIVEGAALSLAMGEPNSADFRSLALGASAVICARATPSQKARVVGLLKELTGEDGMRVLAVGDGGNDVSMIQEAHIGVGIAGKEGLQAARAADYTLGRFRFLQRLLLVHGARAHQRTAAICLYTFYKSIFFASIQLLFNLRTGFSGASLFPSAAVTVWNAPFTMLTGFSLLFDRELSAGALLRCPQLYAHTQAGGELHARAIGAWWARALLQACFVFGAALHAFGDVGYISPASGSCAELQGAGYAAYTAALQLQVLTVYAQHASFAASWTHGLCALCLGLFHLGFWLYTSVPHGDDSAGVLGALYADPAYWLGTATIAMGAALPVALGRYVRLVRWPRPAEVVQQLERLGKLDTGAPMRDVRVDGSEQLRGA